MKCSCGNQYNKSNQKPLKLACSHTFCLQCIKSNYQEQANLLLCSECNTTYNQSPDDVEIDFEIINEITTQPAQPAQKKLTTIVVKETKPQTATSETQKKQSLLRQTTSNVGQSNMCDAHQQLKQYYCQNDQSLVCKECCFAGNHQGHDVLSFENALQVIQPNVSKFFNTLSSNKASLQDRLQDITRQKTLLEKKKQEFKNAVQQKHQQIVQKLEHHTNAQLKEFTLQLGSINQQLDSIATQYKQIIDEIGSFQQPNFADFFELYNFNLKYAQNKQQRYSVEHLIVEINFIVNINEVLDQIANIFQFTTTKQQKEYVFEINQPTPQGKQVRFVSSQKAPTPQRSAPNIPQTLRTYQIVKADENNMIQYDFGTQSISQKVLKTKSLDYNATFVSQVKDGSIILSGGYDKEQRRR